MPYNSDMTARVIGYVPKEMRKRMERLRRLDQWLTISAQVEQAVKAYIPCLEKQHGLTRKEKNTL